MNTIWYEPFIETRLKTSSFLYIRFERSSTSFNQCSELFSPTIFLSSSIQPLKQEIKNKNTRNMLVDLLDIISNLW